MYKDLKSYVSPVHSLQLITFLGDLISKSALLACDGVGDIPIIY